MNLYGWEISQEWALRAAGKGRSLGRANARWLVIKVPPCSVIPESGYPFSGGTRATIKLLLLGHSFVSATTDYPDLLCRSSPRRIGPRKRIAFSRRRLRVMQLVFLALRLPHSTRTISRKLMIEYLFHVRRYSAMYRVLYAEEKINKFTAINGG